MYAIVEDGSRQYRVEAGATVTLDYRAAEAGQRLELTKVLLLSSGADTLIGQPLVAGARVLADVIDFPKTKTMTQQFRRRKNYRQLEGPHAAVAVRVKVTHILKAGEPTPPETPKPAPTEAAPPRADSGSDFLIADLWFRCLCPQGFRPVAFVFLCRAPSHCVPVTTSFKSAASDSGRRGHGGLAVQRIILASGVLLLLVVVVVTAQPPVQPQTPITPPAAPVSPPVPLASHQGDSIRCVRRAAAAPPLLPLPMPVVGTPAAPTLPTGPIAPAEAPLSRFEQLVTFPPVTQCAVGGVVLASEWMTKVHQANGRFLYGYVPALRLPMSGDNDLMQARAAVAMAQAARFTGDQKRAAIASQTILTLLASTKLAANDPNCRVPVQVSFTCNRVAFAALLALAIYELPNANDRDTGRRGAPLRVPSRATPYRWLRPLHRRPQRRAHASRSDRGERVPRAGAPGAGGEQPGAIRRVEEGRREARRCVLRGAVPHEAAPDARGDRDPGRDRTLHPDQTERGRDRRVRDDRLVVASRKSR